LPLELHFSVAGRPTAGLDHGRKALGKRAGRIGRLKLTVEVQLLEIALELLIEPGKPELYPLNVLWRVNRVLQRVGVEKLAPVQPTPHRLEPRRAPRYQPDLFRLISPFRQLGRHFLKPLPSGGEV